MGSKKFSFDIDQFTGANVTLQGDAKIVDGVLVLTTPDGPYRNGVGRAIYNTPLVLWDDDGNVARFETSFTFTIQKSSEYVLADGLIFFLAPFGSTIPPNSTGGRLGIVNADNAFNQFVAVEFDTYQNEWDPTEYKQHIGINVNSLFSLKTTKWKFVNDAPYKATIKYDPSTNILTASATNVINGHIDSVSQVIDLKGVLPAKVNIGLAAAQSTGGREYNNIRSWSFSSVL